MKSPVLILIGLLTFVLGVEAQVPMVTWTKAKTRGWAQSVDSSGLVYPVADQTAMIWMDKPEFRQKLAAALEMAHEAPGLTSNPAGQMNYVIKKLGQPDIKRATDMNGNIFFDGARLKQKVLVVIVNLKPAGEGGGVFIGQKVPDSFQAPCKRVGLHGLVDFLQQY